MNFGDYTISNGHLHISGADTVALAKEYGTPLYIVSEDEVRKNCRELKRVFEKYYASNGMITFASKALCIKEMCRIIQSEDMGLDTVSGGELFTAKEAGFPMSRIHYHGNNKTDEEIRFGVDMKVGKFIIDNLDEAKYLNDYAKEKGVVQDALIRVTPGVDAHTHDFIKTGQIDSKFGFAIETGAADEAVDVISGYENICVKGFHCHIGSQIFESEPFVETARIMLDFILRTEKRLGTSYGTLVLGGGFGIRYVEEDTPLTYEELLAPVLTYIRSECEKIGRPLIRLGFEPGRCIVGSAGMTLYTVGSVKTIPGIRTYVSVDGGMSDNPRYILYGAEYTFTVANRADQKKDFNVTVCGKCCESGDMLGENVPLGEVKRGDLLAVMTTGAYNYSMASNYNRVPKPPVVFVSKGESRIAVKRETFADVCSKDI